MMNTNDVTKALRLSKYYFCKHIFWKTTAKNFIYIYVLKN